MQWSWFNSLVWLAGYLTPVAAFDKMDKDTSFFNFRPKEVMQNMIKCLPNLHMSCKIINSCKTKSEIWKTLFPTTNSTQSTHFLTNRYSSRKEPCALSFTSARETKAFKSCINLHRSLLHYQLCTWNRQK